MAGTPHRLLGDLYTACATDEILLTDPGDGETVDLDAKSGSFLAVSSGDRVMPPAPRGTTVDAFAVEGLTSIWNPNGTLVAVMSQGDYITLKCVTGTTWKAVSSAGLSDFGGTLDAYANAKDIRSLGAQSYQVNPAYADTGEDIQGFFDDMGGSGSSDRSVLALNGDVYHTTDHLTVPNGQGGGLVGTGSSSPEQGTTQYGDSIGTSRIVKTGTNTAGEAVLTVSAEAYYLSGLTLQGYADTTYAAIWNHVADFCDVGLHVPSSSVAGNTGKVRGHSICIACCGTAISLGSSTLGEQADDFTFPGHVWISSCEVGFQTNSVQVVNTHIGTLHCQGVGVGWDAPVGGNSVCDVLYYGELANNITPVAAIRIGSASYSANSDKHVFQLVSLDGSVTTAKILLANNTATAHVVIQCLHVPPTYAVVEPLVIAGPKVVIIESGDVFAGMFRLIETIDGRPNVILRTGVRARTGTDLSLLVTQSGSDGIGYLTQEGTIPGYNGNGGPAARLKQTWNNNVAS